MFDNISSLRFQDGSSNETLATAMLSSECEVMEFRQAIGTEGRVEDWMTNVLNEMRRTNRLITKEAIYKYCDNIERYLLILVLGFSSFWSCYVNFKSSSFISGKIDCFAVCKHRITVAGLNCQCTI